MEDVLLAALQWDPHIRGALIVVTAVLILCGSVYLLLATNTGARMGLLLAVAGLSGWMFLMGIIWTVFGIGWKGRPNQWVAKEIVTGEIGQSPLEVLDGFPDGWQRLRSGDKIYADSQAAADAVLAPSTEPAGGHGGSSAPAEPEFPPVFRSADQYEHQRGWRTGGDNELFTIGKHKFYFRHSPHWVVVQVQPTVAVQPQPGQLVQPEADPSQPPTYVVMVRDLGSVRVPPFLLTLASGLMFGAACYVLHQRDKELMRNRTAAATATA